MLEVPRVIYFIDFLKQLPLIFGQLDRSVSTVTVEYAGTYLFQECSQPMYTGSVKALKTGSAVIANQAAFFIPDPWGGLCFSLGGWFLLAGHRHTFVALSASVRPRSGRMFRLDYELEENLFSDLLLLLEIYQSQVIVGNTVGN